MTKKDSGSFPSFLVRWGCDARPFRELTSGLVPFTRKERATWSLMFSQRHCELFYYLCGWSDVLFLFRRGSPSLIHHAPSLLLGMIILNLSPLQGRTSCPFTLGEKVFSTLSSRFPSLFFLPSSWKRKVFCKNRSPVFTVSFPVRDSEIVWWGHRLIRRGPHPLPYRIRRQV